MWKIIKLMKNSGDIGNPGKIDEVCSVGKDKNEQRDRINYFCDRRNESSHFAVVKIMVYRFSHVSSLQRIAGM
jgi:hypothetical protein